MHAPRGPELRLLELDLQGEELEQVLERDKARIRHAVRKLEAVHPPLGRHLDNSVRTGTFCCYRPERPVAWRFASASGLPQAP